MKNNSSMISSEIFRNMELVAVGGMAQIYRAHQTSLDRMVAIKKLKSELVTYPEVVERFRREARALSAVLHQNIAHVYDFTFHEGEYYIVMEYIDGIDLSEVLRRAGHLPKRVAAAVMLELAQGVAFIHRNGLIHRDIKPTNVRLSKSGQIKLMDFGIVMEQDRTQLTRPGTMIGSPGYLSPEQIVGDPVTLQSDIFLMGISFYEMLTGDRPFFETDDETVFQRIRRVQYMSLKKKLPNSCRHLQKIVSKCLQQDPDDRYRRVEHLIDDLQSYLNLQSSGESVALILDYLDHEGWLAVDPKLIMPVTAAPVWNSRMLKWAMALGIFLIGISIGHFLV